MWYLFMAQELCVGLIWLHFPREDISYPHINTSKTVICHCGVGASYEREYCMLANDTHTYMYAHTHTQICIIIIYIYYSI